MALNLKMSLQQYFKMIKRNPKKNHEHSPGNNQAVQVC